MCVMALWVAQGRPAPADWVGADGTAQHITRECPRLFPGRNAAANVVLPAHDRGDDHAGKRRKGSGGGNENLDSGDWAEDDAIAVGLIASNLGLSLTVATGRMNAILTREKRPTATRNVLRRIHREVDGKTLAKPRSAQGARGADEPCSKAWVELGNQIAAMIEEGKKARKPSGRSRKQTAAAKTSAEQGSQIAAALESWGAISPTAAGILFGDQSHMQVFSNGGKMQSFTPIHPITGRPCPLSEGGVHPPVQTRCTVKFPGEARVDLMVAQTEDAETGELTGVEALPFFHGGGGQGILQHAHICDAAVAKEIKRVGILGGQWGKCDATVSPGGRHASRWPTDWRTRIKKVTALAKFTDVRDLVDHTLAEGKRIFEGTAHEDTWWLMRTGSSSGGIRLPRRTRRRLAWPATNSAARAAPTPARPTRGASRGTNVPFPRSTTRSSPTSPARGASTSLPPSTCRVTTRASSPWRPPPWP